MAEKVAYVVICWNNKTLMDECLGALQKQTYKHKEIYVIDNNSSDGSPEYIAKHFPDVKLIRSSENNGFARGNNIVIKRALKDKEIGYVALVNSDAMLAPDWTSHIVATAKKHPKAAGLQGLTVDYSNHQVVDSHHIYLAENFQGVQYGYKENVDSEAYFTQTVMGVNAAAAIYTRAFIEAQPFDDFFDESFFMYLEDVDVSLRALVMGWENYFVSGATAYHMGSASSNKRSSDFSLYYTARNQFALLCKNLPARVIWRHLRRMIGFELRFRRHLKKTYGAKTARTYAKGRVAGLLSVLLYVAKRRKLAQLRKIDSNLLGVYMKNKGTLG